MAQKIGELYHLHDHYNHAYFGGKLRTITLLAKRNDHRDGYYAYRAHSDDKPIRHELKRGLIVISDGCWDEDIVEETLLHEMVHQYQAEIWNESPEHTASFKSWCRKLEIQENCKRVR